MEPDNIKHPPMNAAQRKKETFIPNVSCAIPKKEQKAKKGLEKMNTYVTSLNSIISAIKNLDLF